jgi:riboflavin kinase/FMN adenylyltransferase
VKKISITLGNFDGVHRGHQSLIQAARAYSEQVHVLTFQPHPAAILSPGRAPVRLMDYQDQKNALGQAGAAQVEVIRFSQEFSQLSGDDFFKHEIFSRSPEAVVVGEDFRFGRKREAGIRELREMCRIRGIQFQAMPPVLEGDRPISSTWIREILSQSDFSTARRLLGRPYGFSGQVVPGRMLGRTIGFPTANLKLAPERESKLPLVLGVYAGQVLIDQGATAYDVVMNIGHAPTVHSDQVLKVEVHFLDFNQDLYGKTLTVKPLRQLRSEQKFSDVAALRYQIGLDVESAKKILKSIAESKV